MSTKTFNLPEELLKKLAKEANQSGLIARLLTSYYKFGEKESPEDLEKARSKIKDEQIRLLDEENQIILKTKEIQSIQDEINSKEEEKRGKEEEKDRHLRLMFKEDLGREVTEEELAEYKHLFNLGLMSYFKYMERLRNVQLAKI